MHQLCQSARRVPSLVVTAHRLLSTSVSPLPLPTINVLRLDHLRLSVRSQLRIEEALLRGSTSKHANYFVLNHPPASERTVVMGISNKTELLVHIDDAERDGVKLLRRFSGGGTVFIDQNCWMTTLIINKTEVESDPSSAASPAPPQLFPPTASHGPLRGVVHPSTLECFPNRLMDWTRDFYAPVFNPAPLSISASTASVVPPFSLTGSDYCFASRKFGGNAQTITKRRWLHHTSFLWTLDGLGSIAKYLRNPKKQPAYRQGRPHEDFLVSLSEVWAAVEQAPASPDHAQQFEQTNAPSESELFKPEPFADVEPTTVSSSSAAATIPAALPSRLLWRLSHFFTLVYPSLDEIAELVRQYDAEAGSAIKRLDYTQERERIRKAAEEAAAAEQAKMQVTAQPI
jgi:lipoate-protein ligase A